MSMEQQVAQFKQQSVQAGFGGSAILDVHPTSGVIRMKVKTASPETLRAFMANFPQYLVASLSAMNIEVKVYVNQEA